LTKIEKEGKKVNVYPKEYLDRFEVIEEQWGDSKYPDAKQLRDRRAKELRKQGFTVKCQKWDFTDLARSCSYSLTATRERREDAERT
jgi:hypothetical protein